MVFASRYGTMGVEYMILASGWLEWNQASAHIAARLGKALVFPRVFLSNSWPRFRMSAYGALEFKYRLIETAVPSGFGKHRCTLRLQD